jgi:membrane protein
MQPGEAVTREAPRRPRARGAIARSAIGVARAILGTARGFRADRGFDLAGSLAFATLLAGVPLLATFSLLLAAFFQENVGTILDIVNSILPYHSAHVTDSLRQFVNQSTAISGIGLAVLLVVSVRLIFNVEGVFNAVWGAPRRRRFAQRVLVYTLVLFGLGLLLGSAGVGARFLRHYGMSGFLDSDFAEGFLPFASEFVVLMLLYRFLPNARVRWGAAAAAAVAVAASLELMRMLFSWYVHALSRMNLITGTLTFLLLTLIAVYLVWVLILLGVELTHVLVTGSISTPTADSMRVVLALSRVPQASFSELSHGLGLTKGEARGILACLTERKFVEGDETRGFQLARETGKITLASLIEALEREPDV